MVDLVAAIGHVDVAPAGVNASPVLEHVWADALPELSRPTEPARPPQPRLLVLNEQVAEEIGVEPDHLRTREGLDFLTGVAPGAAPVAQVYAGHQWGVLKPILGDGRAALLGERRDRDGRLRDLHLKGIGPTSMSRVDGFAVVAPMLREYLMGEAMHALGVPTTRALAVVATGAPRHHDDTALPGAVLARTAASHVRYGTFEYARAHDARTHDARAHDARAHDARAHADREPADARAPASLLRRLADHVIDRHYPAAALDAKPYRALLDAIVGAAASVTVDWMRLGFVHGVLSTDNVLVSGETIDYGPCAFLDAYDPGASFSSIDRLGRYAYDRQPSIMHSNLGRLGHALAPLLDDDPRAGEQIAACIVDTFDARYDAQRAVALRDKLGYTQSVDGGVATEIADAALDLIAVHDVDFTGFWRDLAAAADGDDRAVRGRFLGDVPALDAWLARWSAMAPDAARIRAVNPLYIPRNHLVEEVLEAATDGDLAPFEHLLDLVRDPYTQRGGAEFRRFAWPAPEGAPRHRTFCGT